MSSVCSALGALVVGAGAGTWVTRRLGRRRGARAVEDQWRRSRRSDPLVHTPLAMVLAQAQADAHRGHRGRIAVGIVVAGVVAGVLWMAVWGIGG